MKIGNRKEEKKRAAFQVLRGSDPNVFLPASRNGKFHGVQKADANMSRLGSW
jgi:hypothetical protein